MSNHWQMTDDWQESQRDEEVLQIKATTANRALFCRTPGRPQTPTAGHGESRTEAIGKIAKPSSSAVEASPDHEHISRRLSDLIEERLPDWAGSDVDREFRAHSALKLGNPLQRLPFFIGWSLGFRLDFARLNHLDQGQV